MECINKICLICNSANLRLKIKKVNTGYIASIGHFSATGFSLEEALNTLVKIYEHEKI